MGESVSTKIIHPNLISVHLPFCHKNFVVFSCSLRLLHYFRSSVFTTLNYLCITMNLVSYYLRFFLYYSWWNFKEFVSSPFLCGTLSVSPLVIFCRLTKESQHPVSLNTVVSILYPTFLIIKKRRREPDHKILSASREK